MYVAGLTAVQVGKNQLAVEALQEAMVLLPSSPAVMHLAQAFSNLAEVAEVEHQRLHHKIIADRSLEGTRESEWSAEDKAGVKALNDEYTAKADAYNEKANEHFQMAEGLLPQDWSVGFMAGNYHSKQGTKASWQAKVADAKALQVEESEEPLGEGEEEEEEKGGKAGSERGASVQEAVGETEAEAARARATEHFKHAER
jgi:hypothetical protein